MIWLTYALILLAFLGAAWWTSRPHNPKRCRDCQTIQRRMEQRRRALDTWGNSPTTNSGPYSVRLVGPKPYGMTLQEWLSVNPAEVRAPSGTQVDLLASSNSTEPPGSDTRGRVTTIGASSTPSSTAGQPMPSTSTTSGEGTNRGSNGVADTPLASDASHGQVLGGLSE